MARAARASLRVEVPDAAIWLAEDMVRLELVLHLLKQINPLHIGSTWTQTQRDSCDRFIRTTTAVIRGWKRTASHRLATQFLAP